MDVADELRPGATASEPINHNPELDNNLSKVREEDELSSDDEDVPILSWRQEEPVCSVWQGTSTVAPLGSDPLPPANKCSQDIQVGKSCLSLQGEGRNSCSINNP